MPRLRHPHTLLSKKGATEIKTNKPHNTSQQSGPPWSAATSASPETISQFAMKAKQFGGTRAKQANRVRHPAG
eukprot:3894300-Pyramimonas_sp.AAC.1